MKMPVTGFSFERILAEKRGKISNDLKVSPNLTITNLEKVESVAGSPKGEASLRVSFRFDADYEPNIALISVSGSAVYTDKPSVIDAVLKKQSQEKKLDDKVLNQALGVIQLNAHIKVLELSRHLALPPHIRIPIVQLSNEIDFSQAVSPGPKKS